MADMELSPILFRILVRGRSDLVYDEALCSGKNSEEVQELVADIVNFRGQGEAFEKIWAAFGITKTTELIIVHDLRRLKLLIDTIDFLFDDLRPDDLDIQYQNAWKEVLEAWGIGWASDDSLDYLNTAAEGLRVLYLYAQDLGRI
jgi:hypothetical protein